MADHEVDRAVYDIETEDPRGARRRRPAADWGVSEELFDRMPSPRRRFRPSDTARRDAHPRRFEPGRDEPGRYEAFRDEPGRHEAVRDEGQRGHEAQGQREERLERVESELREGRERRVAPAPAFEPLSERGGSAARAPRRRDLQAVRAAAEREAAAREDAVMLEPSLETPRELVITQDAEPDTTRAGTTSRGGVPGRRTVVIGGQASLARRRPAPTVPERIGPRPDRLAAYAVALGMLLIIIALLSH